MMSHHNSFVSQLSKFLRLNGEKVISGRSKLSLTTSALCQLNTLFDTILFSPCEAKTEKETSPQLLEDVKFLYDFLRKTPSLKIFHEMQTLRGGVDLSRFSNLKTLELLKVPMHLVIGLDVLHSQLVVLICHRSICFLKEIFGNFERAEPNNQWTELKELNIAFNYLKGFDQSLDMLPHVEHLNASHNNLKHVDEILIMKNLVSVNLSFNSLENIPMFCPSLKVLSMRNNCLESLESLSVLPLLEELDVSYNCISEHLALKPLKQLSALRVLNLVGNPLSFHEEHRSLTAWYFHSAVINRGILLDGKMMNSVEVLHTLRAARCSKFYSTNETTHQTAINVIIEDDNRDRTISGCASFTDFTDRARSLPLNITEENGNEVEPSTEKIARGVRKRRKKAKPIRSSTPLKVDEPDNSLPVPFGFRHMQIARKFNSERLEANSSQPPSSNSPSSAPVEQDLHNVAEVARHLASSSSSVQLSSSNSSTENRKGHRTNKKGWSDKSCEITSEYVCHEETTKEVENQKPGNSPQLVSHAQKPASPVGEEQRMRNDNSMSLPRKSQRGNREDDHDIAPLVYLVETYIDDEMQPSLLTLVNNCLKASDIFGKNVEMFDLRSLKAVELEKVSSQNRQIFLLFDTQNLNKRKRRYILATEEAAQEMYNDLKPYADNRVMQDSVKEALQCVKCGSQFSKDCANKQIVKAKNPLTAAEGVIDSSKDYHEEIPSCPNCGSTVVIQADPAYFPSVPDNDNASDKKQSSSASSPKQVMDRNANGEQSILKTKVLSNITPNSPDGHETSVAELKHPIYFERKCAATVPISKTELARSDAGGNDSDHIEPGSSPVILGLPDAFNKAVKPMSSNSSVESTGTESYPQVKARRNSVLSNSGSIRENLTIFENFILDNLFREKEEYSCETFTSIDHRLKLHLEVVLFDNDEILLACLEAGIVPLATGVEFRGLFVISSKRVFVIKLLGNTCDSMEKNLKVILVHPLHQPSIVQALMGNQGFSLSCGSSNKVFVFLVRDSDLCNCFISHLLGITYERVDEIKLVVFVMNVEESISQIYSEVFNCAEAVYSPEETLSLHLFGYWRNKEEETEQPVCFIVTQTSIFVTSLRFKKQTTPSNEGALFHYVPMTSQKILNLLEINLKENLLEAEIMFKDEEENVSAHWIVCTETKSSMCSFLSALKGPWEEMFDVKLPITKMNEEMSFVTGHL